MSLDLHITNDFRNEPQSVVSMITFNINTLYFVQKVLICLEKAFIQYFILPCVVRQIRCLKSVELCGLDYKIKLIINKEVDHLFKGGLVLSHYFPFKTRGTF